jgi:hypothetical protein
LGKETKGAGTVDNPPFQPLTLLVMKKKHAGIAKAGSEMLCD